MEIDDFFNMFDDKARGARSKASTASAPGCRPRRDLNRRIDELQPLLDDLEPVAQEPREPDTRLGQLLQRAADTAGEVAPVAEEQAALFVNLDTTFTALASVARPFIQESISEWPAQRGGRDPRASRVSVRSCEQRRRSSTSCSPAWPRSPTRRRSWPTPSRPAPRSCRRRRLQRELADSLDTLADFSTDPMVHRRREPAHAAAVARSSRR